MSNDVIIIIGCRPSLLSTSFFYIENLSRWIVLSHFSLDGWLSRERLEIETRDSNIHFSILVAVYYWTWKASRSRKIVTIIL
jgi:hypothetical protein